MKQCVLFLLIVLSSGWLYANHWTPVAGAYQNTATITSIIVIDGVEQRTNTLEIGAFCGDECRGSALLRYLSAIDRYETFLTIYGQNGNQMTFKLYDHESQQELDLNTPEAVTFVVDDIVGDPMDPYVLNFTSNGSQPQPTGVVIELAEGWNWISNLLTTETSLEDALVNLTPAEGDIIKGQNSFRKYENGHWEGALNVLTPGKGYLYMREGEATSFTYPENESKGLRVLTISQETVRANTASLQSEVMSDNHAQVIVRGVCWSTNPNPTVEGAHTTDGYGYGRFTSTLTDLAPNTTYYVRPYAMTLNGVCYGQSIELVTESMP